MSTTIPQADQPPSSSDLATHRVDATMDSISNNTSSTTHKSQPLRNSCIASITTHHYSQHQSHAALIINIRSSEGCSCFDTIMVLAIATSQAINYQPHPLHQDEMQAFHMSFVIKAGCIMSSISAAAFRVIDPVQAACAKESGSDAPALGTS